MIEIKEILDMHLWNESIASCVNYNVFNLYEWGEYKKNSWRVLRLALYKKNTFIGATQILYKSKFGIKIGWVSGGILVTNYKHLPEIVPVLKDHFRNKYVVRFNFFESKTGEVSFLYDKCRELARCSNSINSGYTVRFNLPESKDTMSAMSSNNRYYYKRALKNDLTFFMEKEVNISDFVQIHNEMTSEKSLDNIKINSDDINRLNAIFSDKLVMYSVYENEQLLSACLIIRHNRWAYYYLAATSIYGRSKNASFFMVKELVDQLKDEGVINFDFGGITPFCINVTGVNRFKTGFGGEIIRYVGERQISSSGLLSTAFDRVIVPRIT